MVIPDPGILMQAAGAIKNGVDALKNGIELVRTIAGATTGSAEQKRWPPQAPARPSPRPSLPEDSAMNFASARSRRLQC